MNIVYECEMCKQKFKDREACLSHEVKCHPAERLAVFLGKSLNGQDGWKPPPFKEIANWPNRGDKLEFYRLMKNFFGTKNDSTV